MAKVASSIDELDDLLRCTICLETFKDPKYLPCLHSFCDACLKEYISSLDKEGNQGGFSCPVCRLFVSMSNVPTPETWYIFLPTNHFILSLIDSWAIYRSEKNCNSCESQRKAVKAVLWCSECEEAYCQSCEISHKSFKMSSKHHIVSINDVQSNKAEIETKTCICCSQHCQKAVEILCVDHNAPCCTICAIVYHRKCNQVIPIELAAKGVKEKETTKELAMQLDEINKTVESAIFRRKRHLSVLENEVQSIQTEFRQICSVIEKQLALVQSKSCSELVAIQKEITLEITSELAELSNIKATIGNWESLLKTSNIHGSEIQCFIDAHNVLTKKSEVDLALRKHLHQMRKINLRLEKDPYISQLTSNLKSFGSIKTNEVFWRQVNFHTGHIRKVLSINLNTNDSSRKNS